MIPVDAQAQGWTKKCELPFLLHLGRILLVSLSVGPRSLSSPPFMQQFNEIFSTLHRHHLTTVNNC